MTQESFTIDTNKKILKINQLINHMKLILANIQNDHTKIVLTLTNKETIHKITILDFNTGIIIIIDKARGKPEILI